MKIIIVGCGRMGAGLAKKLTAAGHFITVIDTNPTAFELLGSSSKCQTITGVGFDRDVLLQAKVERTDALAAVTASDEANILIARVARNIFKVPRVVARMCDIKKAEIYQRLGMQTIDPTTWGINRISDQLCYSPLDAVDSIGNGAVEIVEIEVPALLVGKKVKELCVPGEFNVIAISGRNKTFVPTLGTEFQEKDVIHLALESSSGNHLRELLGLS